MRLSQRTYPAKLFFITGASRGIGIAVAVALVAPPTSFAQSNAPKTRAEVRADLVQLERAGYNPGANNEATYPAQIQAAEARVSEQNEKRHDERANMTKGIDLQV